MKLLGDAAQNWSSQSSLSAVITLLDDSAAAIRTFEVRPCPIRKELQSSKDSFMFSPTELQ